MSIDVDKYKEALERLATPLAFANGGSAGPEGQARMVYAQAILDGHILELAEHLAAERAREVLQRRVEKSLRD